jgi:hypothetical protein
MSGETTMSMENLEKFNAMVVENPALIEGLNASTDETSFAKIAVEIGAANGCEFTEEEALAWLKANVYASNHPEGELSDLQLEAVSGGGGWPPIPFGLVFGAASYVMKLQYKAAVGIGEAAVGLGKGVVSIGKAIGKLF